MLRWVLGERLRAIRLASGLTASEVARRLGWSPSKLSRIENHEGIDPADVHYLLDAYGITNPADVRPLAEMARQAQQRGWWQEGFGDVLPQWFSTFVGLEAGAAEERDYKGALVTGLLQTGDYARAILSTGIPAAGEPPPGEVERLVGLRLERQRLLHLPKDPLRLWAIMDEAVLRRPIGGADVMRRQLRHLAEISEAPNVTVQVLQEATAHPALDFPFCLLTFPEPRSAGVPRVPGLVYLENFATSMYIEGEAQVGYYAAVFADLSRRALDPSQSRSRLRQHIKDLDDG